GNRAYEDSLRELRDIAIQNGFKIIGAAAFIGEHSYSTAETPLADGRPDKSDLLLAKTFALNLNNKLDELTTLDNMESLKIPGDYPYKGKSNAPVISPETKETICTLCKTCEMVCPTNAVTVADSVVTDKSLCIRCCACIKSCPENARYFDSPVIDKITKKLVNLCSEYREPEFFL
ncbi:MAG: 4Fe-4S binding protein, partial [Spirochaetaceae bacterium]|nr:4Fe-4S binding protein [Spirochaetaceae bacterium]